MDTYDILLYVSYGLVIIGVIIAILLPLITSLGEPRTLLKTGLSFLAILVLFFVCYSISTNEVAPKFEGAPFFLTSGMSQVIGGMLITTSVTEVIKGFK
jgi:glucose uptake protein GlcU